MKFVYNFMCFVFCVLTLGFINIRVKYTDGTKFEWIGWIKRIEDMKKPGSKRISI